MIAAALVLLAALQEPVLPPPEVPRTRTVRSSVRVFIEETPKGEFEHDYYEQALPVRRQTGTGSLGSDIWFHTVCRPQEEDRSPILFTVPESKPMITISGAFAAPQINVSLPRKDPIFGYPRKDPVIITKAGLFGGGDSNSADGYDAPFLYGSDLDYVAAPDVTAWSPTSWLPEGTSFHLFARLLFGPLEIADVETDLQMYSTGPRLSVPLMRWGALELDTTLSVGPAYLHTGIGDAIGIDGGIGLRLSQFFSRSFSFIAEIEANYFRSSNVTAYGPVLNLGFNLSW